MLVGIPSRHLTSTGARICAKYSLVVSPSHKAARHSVQVSLCLIKEVVSRSQRSSQYRCDNGSPVRIGLTHFAAGLHAAFLSHCEWHLCLFLLKFIHLVLKFLLIIMAVHLAHPQTERWQSANTASCSGAGLGSGMVSTTLVYRAFLPPPHSSQPIGPKLCSTITVLSDMPCTPPPTHKWLCDEVGALQKKYGDFVRISSGEITNADPKAMAAVDKTKINSGPCTKGSWYDMIHPTVNMQVTRDRPLCSQ